MAEDTSPHHGLATGDRVRCIRRFDHFMDVGMEFTVIGVGEGRNYGWIAIDNGFCDAVPGTNNWPGGYWFDRFEKVQ